MILGLEKSAKMTEIKKAYRELAMKWHPDRNNQDEEASNKAKEMMAMVNEANETLSNPKKRKDYDLEYEEHAPLEEKYHEVPKEEEYEYYSEEEEEEHESPKSKTKSKQNSSTKKKRHWSSDEDESSEEDSAKKKKNKKKNQTKGPQPQPSGGFFGNFGISITPRNPTQHFNFFK